MKKIYMTPSVKMVNIQTEEMICVSDVDVSTTPVNGGNALENEGDFLNDFGGDDSKSLW